MPESASKCKDIARQLIEDEPGKSINVILLFKYFVLGDLEQYFAVCLF